MDQIEKLHEFIHLAEKNRKYAPNTAHGKRAALKLFETVLHADERESFDLIQERIGEIHLSLISKHKDSFSIQSLNTYKGRFLKVIEDYQRYGKNPDTIATWHVKIRKHMTQSKIEDTKKDASLPHPSLPVHRGVHKLDLLGESGEIITIAIPANITTRDVTRIKQILDTLSK